MKHQFKKIIAVSAVFIAWGIFFSAHAATLSLIPSSFEVGVGEKFVIEARVDSEGVSFNAAQATIRFPKDTLEVVGVDKTSSSFSFWLEEPTFSNTEGTISFTGGTPYGVSGDAVQVLKIEFRAKGSGSGTFTLTEAAISAADGSGTNILSKTNDAVFAVVPARITPKVPEPQKIPEPEQIVRRPLPSGKLPIKPTINISLYPQENRWYNVVGQFTARWDLPLDISGINTALNKNPNFIPPERSEGLFDNKTFGLPQDGIWYLHIRFQNNLGWGPTAHYRIAVDTQPPLGFEINILEGETTGNPAPTLQFTTSDTLSGLKEYLVRIGDGDLIHITPSDFAGSFKLPLQGPGKQKVLVKAVDQADNGIENSLDIEILPIASPVITFTPRELFSEDEQGLVVKGTALPDINVLLKIQKVLRKGRGEIVGNGTVRSDDKGNWEFTFGEQPLRNGRYVVLAQNQDQRGALSLIVDSQEIRVKSKPIIQIGPLQLGKGGAALLLLIILIAGFGGGVWFYKERQEKLAMRVSFTESEITKIFQLIRVDVERFSKARETPTTGDDEYAMKRLQENIQKMETYLKKGIEKIKK